MLTMILSLLGIGKEVDVRVEFFNIVKAADGKIRSSVVCGNVEVISMDV